MKRKLTFRDKLRIIKWWMKEHGDHALIATCQYCKSTRISRVDYAEQDGIYRAKYDCMDCHATADTVENWYLPQATDSTA